MSKEAMVRTFTRPDLRRVAIRLSPTFWQLVDRASVAKGLTWQDYIDEVIRNEPDAQNYTALVRDAAARDLMVALDVASANLSRNRKEVARELICKLLDEVIAA